MKLSFALAAAALVLFVLAPRVAHAQTPSCTRLAVTLLVDRSGSMTGRKLEAAKTGAEAAVDRLGPDDCVAVLAFDHATTTVVPMQRVANRAAIKAAIATIQAGGGTDIAVALDGARQSFATVSRARRKHTILLTDGGFPRAPLEARAKALAAQHVTLSTIGVGSDVDGATLAALAAIGNGRAYKVPSADDVQVATILPQEIAVVLLQSSAGTPR